MLWKGSSSCSSSAFDSVNLVTNPVISQEKLKTGIFLDTDDKQLTFFLKEIQIFLRNLNTGNHRVSIANKKLSDTNFLLSIWGSGVFVCILIYLKKYTFIRLFKSSRFISANCKRARMKIKKKTFSIGKSS